MVATRGHRESEVETKQCHPQRECRKPKTNFQEPEDEIIWESDENVRIRKTRSGVTFDCEKSTISHSEGRSPSLRSKRNSDTKVKSNVSEDDNGKGSGTRVLSKDDDMIGVEADTDTDDDLFEHRRAPAKGRQRSRISKVRRSTSPVKKEFVMNGDDEMTDKSDHETGLRRSLRQQKPVSWILDDRKLRGYPNMIHSSEPENDEIRPARKLSRYMHSSGEKGGSSSVPQRRSQRFRKKSPEQRISRSRNYLLRQSGSRREELSRYQRSRRHRRLPLRYRESQSEEDEEEEEEEEDEEHRGDIDDDDDDDDDLEQEIRGKKSRQRSSKRRSLNLTKKRVIQRKRRVSSRRESIDETENSDEENDYNRKIVRQSQRMLRRRERHEFNDSEASSETEGKDEEEINNDEEVEEKKEKEIASDQKIEKPKRERKPVSRLMYEPVRRCNTKVMSSDGENDDDDEEGEDNDDDNDAADEEEEDEEEGGQQQKDNRQSQRGRYSLRQNRKTIAKDEYECLDEPSAIRHRKQRDREAKIKKLFSSPARKHRVYNKKYRATHNTATSSSSSSGDEKEIEKRYSKSMTKARNRCLPMNFTSEDLSHASVKDRNKVGSSLADIDPMNVDLSVSFESVGGLSHHIKSLKEMIIFPLMYPEVFQKFSITPPRGVLFYGPPGTGKTLVARALASECSKKDKKVAFFMRKGADCLSKWVGESERQLRLLFDQAYQMRPSIIFFDEIDGLAPVRSSRQDQIHSSIVSTLLALMDGLDSRGEVVVIGATNRIDAIDPALRRPGRFDREFHFPLPSVKARNQILNIHTHNWSPRPSKRLLHFLSEQTVGYCGADLKALCAEATLIALRLKYPQIYLSKDKLLLDVSKIHIKCFHFRQALAKIVPAGQRATSSPGRKLSKIIQPLLQPILSQALKNIIQCFPFGLNNGSHNVTVYFPRLLICGLKGQGQTLHLAPAILHALEKVHAHKLDLPSLFSISARAPEEACAQIFHEARRNLPSIIYIPLLDQWWNTVTETVKATFLSLLSDFEPSTPILLLATSETPYNEMDEEVQKLFSSYRSEIMVMSNPKEDIRRLFFRPLFFTRMVQKPKVKQRKNRVLETLPLAPPPQPRKLSTNELQKIELIEEATLRELRIFLRQICAKLAKNRMFYIFTKPVDLDEVPDYLEVISTPMDLETMMTKIDYHHYQCAEDFLNDIDLICANALEYNPDRNPEDKVIRHRACTLRDTAYAYIKAEMDTDFEMKCRDVRKARVYREQSGAELAPDFIKLAAADINEKNGKSNSGTSTPLNQTNSNDLSKSSGEANRKKRRRSTSWARGLLSSAKRRKCVDKDKEDDIKPKTDNEAEAKKNNHEEGNLDCEETASVHSSQREEEGNLVEDISTDASQNKGIEASGLCNGNLSTEDSRDSMKVTSAADLLYNKSLKESIQSEEINISSETKNLKSVASQLDAEESVVSSSEPGCSNENREVRIDRSHLEAVYESCISVTEDTTVDELQYLYNLLLGLTQKYSRSLERDSLLSDTEVELRKFAQFRKKP